MRKVISTLLPLGYRISQCRDVFMLVTHPDKKINNACKELLWYRGTDIYKNTFRAILSKQNKKIPILDDNSPLFCVWSELSLEAKTIVLYLGFHSASTNNNGTIASLVELYRNELSSLFDFSDDEFRVSPDGRALFSELFKKNLTKTHCKINPKAIELYAFEKRTQKNKVIRAKNIIFNCFRRAGVSSLPLFQCLQSKQKEQGCFVIQDSYSSKDFLSVNQHAYNNDKQFEFYMDPPSEKRSGFNSIAHDVCLNGGYYYGSAINKLTGRGDEIGNNCYKRQILTDIADVVSKLAVSVSAPIIYIELNSVIEALTDHKLYYQLERLCNSKAHVFIFEEAPVDRIFYKSFINKFNAIQIIGVFKYHPEDKRLRDDNFGVYNKSEFLGYHKEGLLCEGEIISLDCVELSMQLKGRFIRIF